MNVRKRFTIAVVCFLLMASLGGLYILRVPHQSALKQITEVSSSTSKKSHDVSKADGPPRRGKGINSVAGVQDGIHEGSSVALPFKKVTPSINNKIGLDLKDENQRSDAAEPKDRPVRRGRPSIPQTPAAVTEVLQMQAFSLGKPYRTDWRKNRPLVESGTILVLRVDPDLVYPRQAAEPVLYVGNQTAERIDGGYPSGVLVVVVPGEVDLERDLIWFGTPGLPEQVDSEVIHREQALAKEAKLKPLSAVMVAGLSASAGAKQALGGRRELLDEMDKMILMHKPEN